jgi:V8-like Glu-specific endopeptidase
VTRTNSASRTLGRRSAIAAVGGLLAAAAPLTAATAAVPGAGYADPVGGRPAADSRPAGTPMRVAPQPSTRAATAAAKSAAEPNRTLGLLIFDEDGERTICSAAVVASKHHNLVETAGHCLMRGGSLKYNTNFTFIPGYKPGGPYPHGTFKGEKPWVNYGWGKDADIRADYGFLNLKPNEKGVQVQDAVGANGIEANGPYKALRTVWGYVGFHQHGCVGRSRLFIPVFDNQLRIDCDAYLPGSSGGPWIDDYNAHTELGTVNGVISTSPSKTDHSAVITPYFDDATWSLYETGSAHA